MQDSKVPRCKATNVASVVADGRKIVLLRQQLGWTQAELANRSGYSDRLIRKLENQKPVRATTLADVVQCLFEGLGKTNENWIDYRSDVPFPVHGESEGLASGEAASRLREYVEVVYVQRQIERLAEFIDPQIQFRSEGTIVSGIECIESRARAFLGGFDPIEFDFDRIIETGDTAIGNWHVNMRHAGVFLEVPATGRWVSVRGCFIARYVEGRCVEAEDQFDVESIMRQIGDEPPRLIQPCD